MLPFESFFLLPPIEKRKMVGGKIKGIFYPYLTIERNDTYIYYLLYKYAFFVCVFMSALYLSTYIFQLRFNFLIFEIFLSQSDPVNDFVYSFPFLVPTILLTVVFNYGLVLFKKNTDIDQIDFLEWNPVASKARGKDRDLFLRNFKYGTFALPLAMYGSFCLPYLILKYYNYGHNFYNSISFILVFCIFYSIIYPACTSYLVFALNAYRQNKNKMGPFYKENLQSKNSKFH